MGVGVGGEGRLSRGVGAGMLWVGRVVTQTQKKWGPEGWGRKPFSSEKKFHQKPLSSENHFHQKTTFIKSQFHHKSTEGRQDKTHLGAKDNIVRISVKASPAVSRPTKIPREDPQRGKKITNFAAGEGKKCEILGGPGEGRSWEGRSRKGRSGGTEHDQTQTLKPTPT